jgi:hypothetical protein
VDLSPLPIPQPDALVSADRPTTHATSSDSPITLRLGIVTIWCRFAVSPTRGIPSDESDGASGDT